MDDPRARATAERMLKGAQRRITADPDGFPPVWIYEWLAGGAYQRELMAIPPDQRPAYRLKQARTTRA